MTDKQKNAAQSTRYDIDLPWAFDDGHEAWRETIRDFAQKHVAPGAAHRSDTGTTDTALIGKLAELGVFGLMVPQPYGEDADLRTLCITLDELAYYDSSLAATVHVGAANASTLYRLTKDRPELQEQIMGPICRGEMFVSFGLTEETGGSDAGNVHTRAERDVDGWILNGSKQFITNSGLPGSQFQLTYAKTGERPNGRPEVSAFLVPLDAEGVTVAPGYDKFGWRASDTHPVFFENVRLSADALVGEVGKGLSVALGMLTWARIPFAAISTGLARACVDASVDFVKERESFGKPLSSHQALAFSIADMAASTRVAGTLTYDAAWKYDNGHSIDGSASVAKLQASEIANQVAYAATQIHGGYGFMKETDVVRHYQDARILTIAEGTSEVQKIVIGRALGLKP